MKNYFFLSPKIKNTYHIHFIGIGGSGISGIAKIFFYEGYKISGSDLISNEITKKLSLLGIKIYSHHCAENIKHANIIVRSSAIIQNNPEIVAAKKKRIPIFHRAEMLSELMRFRYGIAISGTHGKTTTTSMIASIYLESGLDPTFINGGLIKSINTNAYLGKSKYIIIEADESDASFLLLRPILLVVTNISKDHMNTYCGNIENVKKTFLQFINNLPFYGAAFLCIDDVIINKILPKINRRIITYGFKNNSDFRICNYKQCKKKGYFQLFRYNKFFMEIELNIPGIHNALNAAASIAIAYEEGIEKKYIINALKKFKGTERRFEILGEFSLKKKSYYVSKTDKTIFIDDYGHHPTELNETIKTIRKEWPNKKLTMIFQPHRYTRTRDLYKEFISVLSKVDTLFLLDIYPSGELPIDGYDSESLCKDIFIKYKIKPIYVSNKNKILKMLPTLLKGNNIVLLQGAGDISNLATKIKKNLKL